MSRAWVISDLLDVITDGGQPERERYVTALAILGALGEYERGERDSRTSDLFDRIRSGAEPVETAGSGHPPVPDPASSAGVDATIREDVGGLPEALRSSTPAVTPVAATLSDVTISLAPSGEVAVPLSSSPEPFACSGCGKTYALSADLASHRALCAGLSPRTPAPAPARPPAEPIGQHTCEYCGRMFTSGAALGGHQTYCAGAKRARLAKRQGAHVPDPPAADLGLPPVDTTGDQIPPGMALICSTCDTVYRNAAVLNSHTHRAHGRTATREERTPQRVEQVS